MVLLHPRRSLFYRICRGLLKGGLRVLAGGFPLGDLIFDVGDEVAQGCQQAEDLAQLRAEIEAVAQLGRDEIRAEKEAALAALRAEGVELPPAETRALEGYLDAVQPSIRQRSRRPTDSTGTTLPPTILRSTGQLAREICEVLPQRPFRFREGDAIPALGPGWVLVAPLGQGGFGEVWLARKGNLVSAVKFCLAPTALKSLQRDVEILDRIIGLGQEWGGIQGIVQLQDYNLQHEPFYVRMEYVPGGELTRVIEDAHRDGQQPDPKVVASDIQQLARILAPLHAMNPPLVHRDLKPANILVHRIVDGRPEFRIADFGISGLAEHEIGNTNARSNTFARGSFTIHYASPEQIEGDLPRPTDDIHALGVIWYQELTGNLRQGVPGGFDRLLRRAGVPLAHIELLADCISPDRQDRPQTAEQLAARLEIILKLDSEPTELTSGSDDSSVEVLVGAAKLQEVEISKLHARVNEMLDTSPDFLAIGTELEKIPSDRRESQLQQRYEAAQKLDAELRTNIQRMTPRQIALLVLKLLTYQPRRSDLLRAKTEYPLQLPGEFTNSLGMKFKLIQPGEFLMGSNEGKIGELVDCDAKPVRRVCLTQLFYAGVYQVTQEEYRAVVGNNPSHFKGGRRPVESVSWDEANLFCDRLNSRQHACIDGYKYRLFTEAEWEYCCRTGQKSSVGTVVDAAVSRLFGKATSWGADPSKYSFGDREAELGNYAWYRDCFFWGETHEVGLKRPNPWGLFDMHGNVWEWCLDSMGDYDPQDIVDPRNVNRSLKYRVLHGGGWGSGAVYCRSACRYGATPGYRNKDVGFRVTAVLASH